VRGFLVRLLISAGGLWLASKLAAGVVFDDAGTLVAAALLLGVVNAVVRPVAVLLTFPLTIVTLGLFLLVVNAAMLGLVAWLLPGFHLAGLGSALLATMVVGATGWAASSAIGPSGRIEIIAIERRAS
jgi:putative membrane protein